MSTGTSDWKNEFFSLQEKNMVAKAHNLKLSNLPKKLYKYRKLNCFTLQSISNSEVFLEIASEQNDPYDSHYTVNFIEAARNQCRDSAFWASFKLQVGFDMPQEYIDEMIKSDSPMHSYVVHSQKLGLNLIANPDAFVSRQYEKWHELVEKQREKIRISCFAERPDSILMWSHYANFHRGICVEYDLAGDANLRETIQPVQYLEEQYDVTHLGSPHYRPEDISSAIYIAALTKAKEWEYENEWRIINNIGKSLQPMPKPTAIYLGTCFDKNDETEKDKFLATAAGIKMFRMKMHHSKFTIEPE